MTSKGGVLNKDSFLLPPKRTFVREIINSYYEKEQVDRTHLNGGEDYV